MNNDIDKNIPLYKTERLYEGRSVDRRVAEI